MTQVQFTLRSRNGKVGPIPVSTTSNDTCPDACPLKTISDDSGGCYAENGPLGILWRALSKAKPGRSYVAGATTMRALSWSQFCRAVSELAVDTFWRHNQAGDLPGQNDKIDSKALGELVKANRGKRGFTYSHKPLTGPHGKANAAAIKAANQNGFTINLSADNLVECDELAATGVGPVVVVLPESAGRKFKGAEWLESIEEYRARYAETFGPRGIVTPNGQSVKVCPATYLDTSCADCQLCQRQARKVPVGFPAHGASKRKADKIASYVARA